MTDPNKPKSPIDSIPDLASQRTPSAGAPAPESSEPPSEWSARLVRELEEDAPKPIRGPRRIAAYIRYATSTRTSNSGGRQEANIRTDCSVVLPDAEIEVFTDPNTSGAHGAFRPEFDRMMARVREGDFDDVVVEELDRLSRDLREGVRSWREIAANGVVLHSVGQKKRLDESDFAPLTMSLDDEVRKFKLRAQQATGSKARRRRPTVAAVERLRVFREGKDAGSGEVVSDATVHLIHDLALQGIPAREIAQILNGEGVIVGSASTPTSATRPS